jgi:hypothetical protein
MANMVFLMTLFSASLASAVVNDQPFGTAREIILPAFQFAKMKADLPITAAAVDSGDALWLTGQQSIWRWELKTNQLQKIRLLKDLSSGPLRDLLIHQDSLFATTDRDLFQINFNPLLATRLKSNDIATKSIGMTSGGKHLYWITSKGVFAADPMQKSLMHLTNAPDLGREDKAVFIWESGSLWYSQGGKLFLRNMISEKPISKQILATKEKVKNIYRSGSEIFVNTRFSVLRYNLEGDLLQTIPVEGSRRLVLMNPYEEVHHYLFSDKLLEIFQLKKKKTLRYQLDIGRVQQATRIVAHDSMVGLVLDGKPRAFQLSGKW